MIGKENGLLFAALIVMVLFTAGCATSPQATNIENLTMIQSQEEHTISSNGEARMMVEPDLLVVVLEIETSGDTASDAQGKNADISDEVTKSLKANGLEDKDIKSSYYNVYEDKKGRWVCPEGNPECEEHEKEYEYVSLGYKAVHRFTVNVEDTDKGGKILDDAVDAGVTEVYNIYFTLKDETRDELENQLLSEAAANAKEKAGKIAEGLGVTIGTPTSASTGSVYWPTYKSYDYAEFETMAAAMPAPATQLSGGEMEVSASVSASFLIE